MPRFLLYTVLVALVVGSGRCGCLAFFSLSMKVSSSQATAAAAVSFWNGPHPSLLSDPPSPNLLERIKESPYRGGFEPAQDNIEPYCPKIVQGAIPDDLIGSLATNGPGRIRIGETHYGHWFDGDGYVTLVTFKNGTATFRAKYVRTDRFRAQEHLMKKRTRSPRSNRNTSSPPPLAFSGAWTLAGHGQWYENILRIPTNPSNTATMWIGTRLFALCEGGDPIELDPCTLDTIGFQTPFRGPGTKVNSFFSAHFSRDFTGDIYNHGYVLRLGPGPARLNLMKLSADGVLLQQRQCDLPFDTFVHDSTLSPNYVVYVLPPYFKSDKHLWKFLMGVSPIGKLFEWNPQTHPTWIYVHSKQKLKGQWCIKLPTNKPTTLYHLVDAYDEVNRDGTTITLTLRVAEHVPPDRKLLEEQFADQYSVKDGTRLYTTLREYTIVLGNDGLLFGDVSDRDLCKNAAPCEFPIVNAAWKPNDQRQYCWTNALSSESENYLNGIQKIDMKNERASPVVTFGEYTYAGPPAFLPSKEATAEDDGYIVTTVYRALEHRSDIVVLDAATMRQVCTMELQGHVPYQFHGDFLVGFVPE